MYTVCANANNRQLVASTPSAFQYAQGQLACDSPYSLTVTVLKACFKPLLRQYSGQFLWVGTCGDPGSQLVAAQ